MEQNKFTLLFKSLMSVRLFNVFEDVSSAHKAAFCQILLQLKTFLFDYMLIWIWTFMLPNIFVEIIFFDIFVSGFFAQKK